MQKGSMAGVLMRHVGAQLLRAPRALTKAVGLATMLALLVASEVGGQIASGTVVYSSGQNVVPAYEGWEQNPDGTFNMVFGYFNRNLDEKLDIPIGPNNNVEPGGPDQGQPTHFLPRRNRFLFRVKVPGDVGKKELVWTLTVRGKTEKAFGSLRPEYVLDDIIVMRDTGFFGQHGKERENKPPVVNIEGDARRTVLVGQPLALTAVATDDGIPAPRPTPLQLPARYTAIGLRVAWFVYRGSGKAVTFVPEQFKVYPDYRSNSPWTPGWSPPPVPADGKFPVTVTFSAPGTFVLRVMAHDGGLLSSQDVTVDVVSPAVPNR
jgi:hypothetical protein